MKIKNYYFYLLLTTLLFPVCLSAKDYNASLFGIRSNGTTLNTTAIQKAIDHIHDQGGGRLIFYVGRYLTGTIELKSNVSLVLNEGVVLVGSYNPYDYNLENEHSCSLLYAENQENLSITGKGVIDVRGRDVAYNIIDQVQKGILDDPLKLDRPARRRPKAVYMFGCKNIEMKEVVVKNSADWVIYYDHCENLLIDSITVDSKAFWNNDGIDIGDCKNVRILNSFVDASDDGICLKSHDRESRCENIEIRNCVIRSSASGIKFGTVSAGGYKNIRIINNKVYDTFRSAFTIATPDGGDVEDVLVDSLYAYNTGNAIYLRIGERWTKGKMGTINNVTIRNMYAEIPATKPDAGYSYEGPVEDNPRNISPAAIVGLTGGHDITNVTLQNIEIVYPGGANPKYAFRGLEDASLDSIPEMPDAYPEFSQFKELPAWGFYIRHAKGIVFDNVKLVALQKDYRPAIVIQDSEEITLKRMKYQEPGKKKEQVYLYKSSKIKK